jgi:hypothetical protein
MYIYTYIYIHAYIYIYVYIYMGWNIKGQPAATVPSVSRKVSARRVFQQPGRPRKPLYVFPGVAPETCHGTQTKVVDG